MAGAAALMLQANGNFTHDQIEARLKETARTDGFTGNPPDVNTWGSGKLDVYEASRVGKFAYAKDDDGIVVAKVYHLNASIPGGIASYQARISYDAGSQGSWGIQILNMRGVDPFNSPSWNPGGNPITVSASQSGLQPQPPRDLVKVVPRLNGSSSSSRNITLTVEQVIAINGGANFATGRPIAYPLRRGDANSDGSVTITDALFIAQHLAGLRDVGEGTGRVQAVSASSPRHDGAAGDQITIVDALKIAQMLAGLIDDSFNDAGPLGQGGASGQGSPSRGGAATMSNTTAETGSATLAPGGSAQIPVTIRGISDASGLGSYDFRVAFNPQVMRVNNVFASDFAAPTKKIDNTAGVVLFNAYQSDMPGPTGDVIVARLSITATGGLRQLDAAGHLHHHPEQQRRQSDSGDRCGRNGNYPVAAPPPLGGPKQTPINYARNAG